MNFTEAVESYKKDNSKENLTVVTNALMSEMTTRQKIKTLQGDSAIDAIIGTIRYFKVYNAIPWHAGGIKKLGIPPIRFTDGPRGIVMGRKSTAFPVSMLRGATFDDDLEYRVGRVIAEEGMAFGANYFAGVCINLLRHPKWGRAQETYGEDTFLLGKMGAALSRAVQDNGLIACPKHYALNSIEDLRFKIDVQIGERALREVYLPHFKKCFDAGALSVMGAYNKVNGVYACENEYLLIKILREEWGFDGFASSDFIWGVYNAERSLKAGMDVEMPFKRYYFMIGKYLRQGKLTMEHIDTAVFNVLSVMIRNQPAFEVAAKKFYPKVSGKPSTLFSKEHRALSKEVATKGIVLLKNNDAILPIEDTSKKIAVVGRYANIYNIGDYGSSRVKTPYAISAYEGIKAQYPNTTYYNGLKIEKALNVAKGSDYVLVCIGSDHKDEGEFLLNFNLKKKPAGYGGDRFSAQNRPDEVALIEALANAGHKVIVNIIGGSAYVIDNWVDKADAIFTSFYSGNEGGHAIADIVSGKINPSGRLPFTMAKNEADYPKFKHIGEEPYEIEYGYYHGYQLFEKKSLPVRYPFGYGLSYTTFEVALDESKKEGNLLNVSVSVKNTGKKDGTTVVQLYFGSTNTIEDRPHKALKGFSRVEVEAGKTASATIVVDIEDLKFYDEKTKTWVLDDTYVMYVGQNVSDAESLTSKIDMEK